jgi:hypothetical protein
MARKRRESTGEEPPERGEEEEGGEAREGKRPSRRRPKLGNPNADPVKIHREYVEQRLEGGGPETPEAYDEALRQWQNIPGAVSRPPAEVPRTPERRKPEESEEHDDDDDDDRGTESSS